MRILLDDGNKLFEDLEKEGYYNNKIELEILMVFIQTVLRL